MCPAIARFPAPFTTPDFEKSGYIGSFPITDADWKLADSVAHQRQSIAAADENQKLKDRNVENQSKKDLKGAIAEIAFSQYFARVVGTEFEAAALVADKPVPTADIKFGGMLFDVKGCAGLVKDRTTRDDKLMIIRRIQHDVKYKGFKGYFFVKSYAGHVDIFYYNRSDVGPECGWELMPGRERCGQYYSVKLPLLY